MIQHLKPQNMRSFGPDFPGIDLQPLNILIGPNGSGKSNLIDTIDFMRASITKDSYMSALTATNTVRTWMHQHAPDNPAAMECTQSGITHGIQFTGKGGMLRIIKEYIKTQKPVYSYQEGETTTQIAGQPIPTHGLTSPVPGSGFPRKHDPALHRSILSASNPNCPETTEETWKILNTIRKSYEQTRIYRSCAIHENKLHMPQELGLQTEFIEEDFSNLNIWLHRMKNLNPDRYQAVVDGLKGTQEQISDLDIQIRDYRAYLSIKETNGISIPAKRMSSGTLHYLCLLAILHDPNPPQLICIENPEEHLHLDLHHKIADLMVTASKRTQLIVTTHSEHLVDAMTPTPEAVIICEKHDGKTTLQRLDAKNLDLNHASLAELWTAGDLGGNHW